jgi:predicted transcriptional regulator YdeE
MQMEPLRQHRDAFAVAGLTIRTTNDEEIDPATARIGALWGRFFADPRLQAPPHRTDHAHNYGVYSNYESDALGAFDVTAGVAVAQGGTAQVEAGDYLVWSGDGEMPQAVLGAWQRIWAYFEAHPEVRRRYVSDFEAYTSPTDVKVYIGVE